MSTFLQEDELFDNTARDRRSEYLQIICLYTYRGNMYHYIHFHPFYRSFQHLIPRQLHSVHTLVAVLVVLAV